MRAASALAALLGLSLLSLTLLGCGGNTSAPRPAQDATSSQQEAISRIGDVTIRASAVPTQMLPAQMASQYGIPRDARTVMLLVAVRQGPEGQETAAPATITATATLLSGERRDIPLRELRSGELLDYVGTLEVTPPDTLRFDLRIVREGGATSTMQFSREFYPQ